MSMARSAFPRTFFVVSAAILLLTGCGEADPRLAYEQTQYLGGIYGNQPVSSSAPVDTVSYWDGEGMPGKTSVTIRLSEQRAYFYKGGKLISISQLATRREGKKTPSGKFKISQKDPSHVSSMYGDYVD